MHILILVLHFCKWVLKVMGMLKLLFFQLLNKHITKKRNLRVLVLKIRLINYAVIISTWPAPIKLYIKATFNKKNNHHVCLI